MSESESQARSFDELLTAHRARKAARPSLGTGSLVTFNGIPDGKDAYNPSGVFVADGIRYQWARVESHDAQDSVAVLFQEVEPNVFSIVQGVSALPLEDPFTTWIGDTLVVGGVEIRTDEHGAVVGYRTRFYRGSSPQTLIPFSCGPDYMKDIRIAALQHEDSQELVIFTRSYILEAGRMVGRIAVTTIATLDDLTPERLIPEHTELLTNLFAPEEWGGVNDTYILPNGRIGALAHVSKYDAEGKRHYAAAAFVYDPRTKWCSPLEIFAERGDFPMGPVKIMPENLNRPEMHDDLADVVFSSRLVPVAGDIMTAQTLQLTCGLSDAAVGVMLVPNPFPALCYGRS